MSCSSIALFLKLDLIASSWPLFAVFLHDVITMGVISMGVISIISMGVISIIISMGVISIIELG